MAVFFVHDVGSGLVTPLDRKFRVRDIPPTDELNETPRIHDKKSSDAREYQSPDQKESLSKRPAQQAAEYYRQAQDKSFIGLGRVKDIMSSPILSIQQDRSLSDAWLIMEKYEIHHLAIVNNENAYCGMLSEKKIVPFLMANSGGTAEESLPENTPLSVFCQESLLSTHPDTPISALGPALLEYGLDGIAVTNNGELAGMVTYSDIMKIILKTQTLKVQA